MTTSAEQEAERRYLRWLQPASVSEALRKREAIGAFVSGAEWALEQHRELLEAAREYREARYAHERAYNEMNAHFWDDAHDETFEAMVSAQQLEDQAMNRLLAAAAALPEETP